MLVLQKYGDIEFCLNLLELGILRSLFHVSRDQYRYIYRLLNDKWSTTNNSSGLSRAFQRILPRLCTFLSHTSTSGEKKKSNKGRDTLARGRIPIVGLVPSFIFFAPLGTQWIVERLIVYCMIIDILPEILLIYINFIANVEHSNIWGYLIRAIPSVFIGDTLEREYYIER